MIEFLIMSLFAGIYGAKGFLENPKDLIGISIFAVSFWLWQIKVQQQISMELIDQMQDKIDEQSMFKVIINNLQESIIVTQQDKINIVNDKFLNEFREMIRLTKASKNAPDTA